MPSTIHDVVNRVFFFENRPKVFGASRPRNLAFPIDFAGRPHNTLTLPCERVIPRLFAMLSLYVSVINSKLLRAMLAVKRHTDPVSAWGSMYCRY